ncbi:glycine betaine ABC transporter substrate-binding protein [Oceanobacillus polygoni]|uniref:Glycine betaine/proline transport system substrate-binding protein n=1 Tax=Oceanobacillus polygoni TaxID=1235259 RepID=A0A9X1CEC2_9BACI|nr:glycine betaine ABC transporter substrate-binding protein [Oceanobacillus polygoni]MBP2076078.1 glycine betaine/proline transport system substrate-binding protein [Oceanobacillus polygoni]
MIIKNTKVFIVGLLFLMVLTACSGESDGKSQSQGEGNKTIVMGQINWAENIAVTNMWKVILEDKGYELDLRMLDMGTQMAALQSGDLDVSTEVWLPIQDASYLEQYQETVNFSEETWYDNAKVGLIVPSYMEDINSIEDLNTYTEELEGTITGFDPGAGTMEVTEEVIAEYDLDVELLPSSEPAMIAAIDQAIKNGEAIVAPLWSPHRIFSEMDLKYLDDPKKVYGDVEKIHHATRQGFEEDFPEIDKWLKNWKMDDEAIGQLMSSVGEAEDPLDGAREWVEENQDLVNEWME